MKKLKTIIQYLGVALGGLALLVIALFQFVLSDGLVNDLAKTAMKLMGFMSDGRINVICPILTFLLFVGVLSICSYQVIHRTEL